MVTINDIFSYFYISAAEQDKLLLIADLVHDSLCVKATVFYGIAHLEKFIKVYLKDASTLSKAISPFTAVYDAHLGHLLQFRLDYNIYDTLDLSFATLRHSHIPSIFSDFNISLSNLPTQSHCAYEMHTWPAEILNRTFSRDPHILVPSLAKLWDDENSLRAKEGLDLIHPKLGVSNQNDTEFYKLLELIKGPADNDLNNLPFPSDAIAALHPPRFSPQNSQSLLNVLSSQSRSSIAFENHLDCLIREMEDDSASDNQEDYMEGITESVLGAIYDDFSSQNFTPKKPKQSLGYLSQKSQKTDLSSQFSEIDFDQVDIPQFDGADDYLAPAKNAHKRLKQRNDYTKLGHELAESSKYEKRHIITGKSVNWIDYFSQSIANTWSPTKITFEGVSPPIPSSPTDKTTIKKTVLKCKESPPTINELEFYCLSNDLPWIIYQEPFYSKHVDLTLPKTFGGREFKFEINHPREFTAIFQKQGAKFPDYKLYFVLNKKSENMVLCGGSADQAAASGIYQSQR
jgi:hypothetical protein